ncbi:hypothetical protein [Pseudomonas aeruginosa]|uniref:hypothetical protein n=1 Tax=Pseudomonas aeruginosa TaxID=287 RepID=UPI003FCFAE90
MDTGRILLLYQARTFVLLPKSALDISEETNRQIDVRIGNGFQQIGNTAPDLAPRLAPIQRRYQFARDKADQLPAELGAQRRGLVPRPQHSRSRQAGCLVRGLTQVNKRETAIFG